MRGTNSADGHGGVPGGGGAAYGSFGGQAGGAGICGPETGTLNSNMISITGAALVPRQPMSLQQREVRPEKVS